VKNKAEHVYEKWCVDYVKMDKKRESIRDNFDQLFFALYNESVSWEDARNIADEAIKHHLPTASTAKHIWGLKKKFIRLSYKEWVESWEEDIRNKGLASFYDMFPLESNAPKKEPPPKTTRAKKTEGIKTDDELNAEDFYNSTKLVTKDNPRLFGGDK
jgi:hypothetical protein